MKIVFVRPKDVDRIPAETPRYEMPFAGYYPPLGMMSIATCVNEWTDHTAYVLDGAILGLNDAELTKAITKEKPDVVGVSSITFTLLTTLRTANLVKQIDPDLPVVVGGAHANLFPQQTVAYDDVDFVVTGDGELSFTKLLTYLEGTSQMKELPGVMGKERGKIVVGKPAEPISNLDDIPPVDRNLTPYKKYSSVFAQRKPTTIAITSRGCPNQCSFCYLPLRDSSLHYRFNTPQRAVDELRHSQDLGVKELIFYDDTFTADKTRVKKFCELLKHAELDITWDIRTRPDLVDRDLLYTMKDAGLRRIQLGAESGTQDGLDSLNKKMTLGQVKDGFSAVKESGLDCLGYFMLGLPDETREMMLETIRFSLKLDPDYANYAVFTPLPGTHLWDKIIHKGDASLLNSWQQFVSAPTPEFDVPTYNAHHSKKELLGIVDSAYKQFYLRPKFALREIKRIRSPREAVIKASTVARVMNSLVRDVLT